MRFLTTVLLAFILPALAVAQQQLAVEMAKDKTHSIRIIYYRSLLNDVNCFKNCEDHGGLNFTKAPTVKNALVKAKQMLSEASVIELNIQTNLSNTKK